MGTGGSGGVGDYKNISFFDNFPRNFHGISTEFPYLFQGKSDIR